jgi:ABC-type xylose transport system permease subunit
MYELTHLIEFSLSIIAVTLMIIFLHNSLRKKESLSLPSNRLKIFLFTFLLYLIVRITEVLDLIGTYKLLTDTLKILMFISWIFVFFRWRI